MEIIFDQDFLQQLAKEEVIGDFPPFDTGDIIEVEKYIKVIVGRIKDDYRLLVEPDFSYYGSGFASYISVKVSAKDGSGTKATQKGNRLTHDTEGLLIYISNLTPYWYYGASSWSVSVENGKIVGGSSGFIRPESIEAVDKGQWSGTIEKIQDLFEQYGYSLLPKGVLAQPVYAKIKIRTVLADRPYAVFDFFFHWSD